MRRIGMNTAETDLGALLKEKNLPNTLRGVLTSGFFDGGTLDLHQNQVLPLIVRYVDISFERTADGRFVPVPSQVKGWYYKGWCDYDGKGLCLESFYDMDAYINLGLCYPGEHRLGFLSGRLEGVNFGGDFPSNFGFVLYKKDYPLGHDDEQVVSWDLENGDVVVNRPSSL